MKLPATGALTGRAVEEWVGASNDTPVPPRVRLRVFERHNGICYLTGRKIRPGDTWDLEHVHALHAGGEHREGNFAPALTTPHKKKTAEERALKADIEASRKKHLGITKPKKPWPKRTFGQWQKPATTIDPDT
jgi:5-methylcytosine-specific restriction protein A